MIFFFHKYLTYPAIYDKVNTYKNEEGFIMAKKCTSKKPLAGNLRSHACNAVRHMQKPNLQKVTNSDGTVVRMSTRELRTLKKDAK